MKLLVFVSILTLTLSIMVFQFFESNDEFHTYLNRSVPFIGGDIVHLEGYDGKGIKIAIIDTGVDFNHPDIYGWGPDGKVIGGYNFIHEGELPLDTNGHGTQVAGIVAADGVLVGVAPKSKILAYKVSEDGEAVSSDLIIRAINKAIEDEADIINISLGVNQTNEKIDSAVNKALDNKIFVVTASGNDGPMNHTIGSPGRNYGAVTVGATYNNLTSSLVATLEVNEKPYTVIPMAGSSKLDEPIIGKIVLGEYGKEKDFEKINATGSILLVERGSDVKDELLYFSIKEKNAAAAGAKALIVYNNEPGIFLGELIHEFVEPDYKPQIPVVSIDRKDGLEIKEIIQTKNEAILHLFYNPDFVAHFSSRGPVSPFYIKPDIVAPGAYINTTQITGGYNLTSGTSFAAPHVSGAAALLLEKYPNLSNSEIKSLLLTTAEMVSDPYGKEFSVFDSGSGRLNIEKAFQAKLIISPPNFVVDASFEHPSVQKILKLKLLEGSLENLKVDFIGPDFIQFNYVLDKDNLQIALKLNNQDYGDYEGKIIIYHNEIRYTVPFLMHYTEGSVLTNQQNGTLNLRIENPEIWDFAKISVINSKDGKTEIVTSTPQKNAMLKVFENTEFWIEAKIKVGEKTLDAYSTILVNSADPKIQEFEWWDLPQRQIVIISGFVIIVGIIGIIANRTIRKG